MDHGDRPDQPTEGLAHWPTDAVRDVKPIACHSHNDYWRPVPLYSAIQAGCTSVEADVWLFDNELYVGHTTSSLTAGRTLRSLYIQPLLELLTFKNETNSLHGRPTSVPGVFDTDPSQTLVLLIDFKTSGVALWPELVVQLLPLRERGYLTYFDGTTVVERLITIVASGDAPFDLILANQSYRDIFYDAPLDRLSDLSQKWPNPNRVPEEDKAARNALSFSSPVAGLRPAGNPTQEDGSTAGSANTAMSTAPFKDGFTSQNSYFGSTSFHRNVGPVWGSRLSQRQLQILRAQIRGAHERGLKVRYWDLPYWPVGFRNHIWHILIREGADVLSVDDLPGATRTDWRRRRGWWR
ncbi:MAG: hypothetical protein Q9218_006356 [Villophora microphyllina]